MLTESLVISTVDPEKQTNNTSTGIHVHELQPLPALKSTFKKSSSKPNCLAVSQTHVFAAQSGKAVVNVYNRDRNNQETTVPFPERISALTLALQDDGAGVLVLGTEEGRIILWELGTGRQVFTAQHHLQPVTCLAVDLTSNFLISGSPDSSLHIWSVVDLLSFRDQSESSLRQEHRTSILHSLTTHRAEVTAVAFGHSASRSDIAISASKDKTLIVWNYRDGSSLRTYLLRAPPACLAVDPADRAVYVGYEDGRIQLINFYKDLGPVHPLYNPENQASAAEAPESDCWESAPDCSGTPVHCLDISYDGTMIMAGYANGKIIVWDVAKGRVIKPLMDCGAPVTSLITLTATGFPNAIPSRTKLHNVTKPRYESLDRGASYLNGSGIPGDYNFTAQLVSEIPMDSDSGDGLQELLSNPCFPEHMLAEASEEIQSMQSRNQFSSDSQAIADLQKEKESLASQLQTAKQEIKERDQQAWRRQQDEEVKAAKKKRRRLAREKADEVHRKQTMGEPVSKQDEEMQEVEDEALSSSTDELLDSD